VITSVEKGRIPCGQYGAVMVDEGHDFEPDWLRLVVQMVDSDTSSLLLLYDDAQSIYSKNGALDFSLSSVGVQARGRTTVLRLNYRNTDEILKFAYRFVSRYLDAGSSDEDHIPLIEPQGVDRHGPKPVIRVFERYEQEARYIARLFRQLHEERGMNWSDMCVTYRNNWMGKVVSNELQALSIPHQLLDNSRARKAFKSSSDSIKLMTMHSSKGLEFPMVAVSGIGYMPVKQADPVAEAKLLYVAMTRSTENLTLTSHRETDFLAQLRESVSD